jgi:hypothetical protein
MVQAFFCAANNMLHLAEDLGIGLRDLSRNEILGTRWRREASRASPKVQTSLWSGQARGVPHQAEGRRMKVVLLCTKSSY